MAYDLDTLCRGRQTILDNILALEEGLSLERAKLSEYDKHIMEAELILKLHGVDSNDNKERRNN